MKKPKISVLMPVYNAEKFLNEAIDSILEQTFKDYELLIINDASTDRSKEIILSYKDPRIRYFENKKNLGRPRTSNKGLRLAKADYVARMDADDVSLPDRLKTQLEIVEKDNNVGLVASWIVLIDENNNNKGGWHTDRKNNSPEEIFYTLFFENCLANSSVLFKKDIVLKIGGYNESFERAQDYELWSRLAKLTKIVKIRKVGVKYRTYAQNTTPKIINQQCLNEQKVFLKNVSDLLSEKINSDILLSIKYNNSASMVKKNKLFDILSAFNKINGQLIASAPRFLNKEKLRRCGQMKKYTLIKKYIMRKSTLNGLLSAEKINRFWVRISR